jgi:hypothetical protein
MKPKKLVPAERPDVGEALAEILSELREMRSIMEQFQKFVLEVTPDDAISAVEELEEQLND